MRVSLVSESTESQPRERIEAVIVPDGEYLVRFSYAQAGETSKKNPKLSIPTEVIGGVYPLDAGGLLEGQTLISGNKVVGASDWTAATIWINLHPLYWLRASNICAGPKPTDGYLKNAEIVAQNLRALGLPSASDPADPFYNVSAASMSQDNATELLAEFFCALTSDTPREVIIRTEQYTYGDDNRVGVGVKSIRTYREVTSQPTVKAGTSAQPSHITDMLDSSPFDVTGLKF